MSRIRTCEQALRLKPEEPCKQEPGEPALEPEKPFEQALGLGPKAEPGRLFAG